MYDVKSMGSFNAFSPPPGHDDQPRMNGFFDDLVAGAEVGLGITPVIAAFDAVTGSSVQPNVLLNDNQGSLSVKPSGTGDNGGRMMGGAALTGAVLAALAAHGYANDVRGFQGANGLSVDGVVGPNTLAKLGLGLTPAPTQSSGLSAPSSTSGTTAPSFFSFLDGDIMGVPAPAAIGAGVIALLGIGLALKGKKKKGAKR